LENFFNMGKEMRVKMKMSPGQWLRYTMRPAQKYREVCTGETSFITSDESDVARSDFVSQPFNTWRLLMQHTIPIFKRGSSARSRETRCHLVSRFSSVSSWRVRTRAMVGESDFVLGHRIFCLDYSWPPQIFQFPYLTIFFGSKSRN